MSADRDTLDLERIESQAKRLQQECAGERCLVCDVVRLVAEVRRLRELRQRGCDCNDEDACLYARERDEARAQLEARDAAIREAGENAERFRRSTYELEARVYELRSAIVEAPHGDECAICATPEEEDVPCDCWKVDAGVTG